MRLILTALAVGLFATAAQADGVSIQRCEIAPGGVAECAANLVKGQDYVLGVGHDEQEGTAELINPANISTITQPFELGWEYPVGREFRAAYTAKYLIRLTASEDGAGLSAWLDSDCQANTKTLCSLSPGANVSGTNSTPNDYDWY